MPTRKSILVVDDDPSMRLGMERLLGLYGFNTRSFASADALLRHGDFSEAFCIILDINLNGESGIALGRRLMDEGLELPVIYITGNDSEANRAAAIASGCIAYLTKPFAASSLIELIERVRAAA